MEHFPRRPPLNISFLDITYSVPDWSKLCRGKKEILKGLSGAYKAGELTGIMGPSGAGKTTLLNILAGFILKGSGGEVLVNGKPRSEVGLDKFQRVSCYIQQEDQVRPFLTVMEAMSLAQHLKLGSSATKQRIEELLEMLGLSQAGDTLCGRLSGGQKKRLSIALELITNPPILFLDEPTSGLDSSNTSSTLALLRHLAEGQGRTVVCTIHQPSALLFHQFSHVYCVNQGVCLYQGPPEATTAFLLDHGLRCPPYHNPADFLIEVAVGEYGCDLEAIAESTDKMGQMRASSALQHIAAQHAGLEMFKKPSKTRGSLEERNLASSCLPQPPSVWIQTFHLYNRNVLTLRRNMFQIGLRMMAHLLIGLIFGYLYRGAGEKAGLLLANYVYVYGTCLFLHYTAQMSVLLSFPLEYSVLTREHFNKWYSLAPYYVALLLVEVPYQMACAALYLVPSFFLTRQLFQWSRFWLFILYNMALTVTAQGTGYLAGANLPITIAVFLAPVIYVFLSVFGFTTSYESIPEFYKPFYNFSYFRAGFHGSLYSIYGYDRDPLLCPELYCHYKAPTKFLKEMGLMDVDMTGNLGWLLGFGAIMYILTLLSVWYKLNKR